MKKLTVLLFCILTCFCIQVNAQQTVIPKDVYVGDHAEARYTFQTAVDIFDLAAPDKVRVDGDFLVLNEKAEKFSELSSVCTVSSVRLQRIGITYTLIIQFTPWKTGWLDFGKIDFGELCGVPNLSLLNVEFKKFEISSLSDKLGVTSLRSPVAPLLLPGTNYLVWALVICVIIFLVLLAIFILRFSYFVRKYVIFREILGYKKNARLAKKKLLLLQKQSLSDAEFAYQWQMIIRNYLTFRFGTSFASVTAKNLVSVVSRITGDMLSIEQDNSIESLQALFTRTDYIRYAHDSIDSRREPACEYSASFGENETANIIELSITNINDLEINEEDIKSYG